MGLFGFVKRAVGRIAKAAASKLTGGASDIVLSKLKRVGAVTKNKTMGSHLSPAQEQALVAKLTTVTPSLKNTTTLIGNAGAGAGTYGRYAKKKMPGGKKKPPSYYQAVGGPMTANERYLNALEEWDVGGGAERGEAKPKPPGAAGRVKGFKKDGTPRKPPSAAQRANWARFAAAAKARRGT